MKYITVMIIAIFTLFLTSCAANTEQHTELKEIDVSMSYVSGSDYAAWDTVYSPVIESWRQAIDEDFGSDYSENSHGIYPYLPEFNVSDWLTADTFYAYYDIDANGIAEMLIAGYEECDDQYYLFDIYALKGDEPVRLLEQLTDHGFDRSSNLLRINYETGTIVYQVNEGEFDNCVVYCQIASDGNSAQFIEAFNKQSNKMWIHYTGKLSADTACEITLKEGYSLLSKYNSNNGSQMSLKMLEWRILAPSAISKNAADYLDCYQPLCDTPTEYTEIIESCRRVITVFDNVMSQGYDNEITYNLLNGADAIDYDLIGRYPGGGLFEPVRTCSKEQFGYGIHDINNDGIDELIMMYRSESGVKNVFDIFTLSDGKPKHLFDFYSRSCCTGISEDGRIFECVSGGASIQKYFVRTIEPGGNLLSYEMVYRFDDSYTYFSLQAYDPDDTNHEFVERSLSDDEAKALIEQFIDDDYSDDDAPFVEFIPMF